MINDLSNNYLKNIKLLEKINNYELEEFQMIYLLRAHEYFNNRTTIKELLKICDNNIKLTNSDNYLYIEYLRYFADNKITDLKKYITDNCLKGYIELSDIKQFDYYYKIRQKYNIVETKYKNYCLLNQKREKLIQKIKDLYD
jgi:hypothetical protein